MDRKICSVCKKKFNFDKGGFGVERNGKDVFVCSTKCAKKSCKDRDTSCAIHDETGDIVEYVH